jgi:hypothetical protein
MIMNERAGFDLAVRLHSEGAALGDIFAFISGLYFRGKAAYSTVFAAPPPDMPGSLVITAGRGLLPPETRIGIADLRAIATVPIDLSEPRYRDPLERDILRLDQALPPTTQVILLGSIATSKYLEPLIDVFGSRLLFPSEFVGRGHMSRGGLMLRAASDGVEFDYVPACGAIRRGRRPAKLPKLKKAGLGL